MEYLHLILLGLVQGLTEFLPVSSSAHLILLPLISNWQDQGLAMDVAAHLGTLIAVVFYFRKDLRVILSAGLSNKFNRTDDPNTRMFLYLIIATVPAFLFGFLGHDFIAENLRDPLVIAVATIGFGFLLWWSDVAGQQERDFHSLSYKDVLWIGLAQALALIPGTSRSGVTMTAALMLGLNRETAARFSFLLSIPVISLAACYEGFLLIQSGINADIESFFIVMSVSSVIAWITIKFFLKFIEKTGMLPYVIYRLILGSVLLYLFL